ncbi:uncharacterized protein K489DRAFT_184209 [Dissoconium aciculare CBS 342.82]|uniref:Uncharacterized protein n=1 Tax=Dissoconium aciculare CBS 342.82 TaxID=1314786 RepID=A0A6J3M902_9PEZI|nr:uncharacterized protein K489DRAFT_184209 [Dissoconium aciculare CBS 342.82]KAF1824526.1 hypothetical protein K489DRAFT_184209 [Dissoconium aciculare CBS 342.82]
MLADCANMELNKNTSSLRAHVSFDSGGTSRGHTAPVNSAKIGSQSDVRSSLLTHHPPGIEDRSYVGRPTNQIRHHNGKRTHRHHGPISLGGQMR